MTRTKQWLDEVVPTGVDEDSVETYDGIPISNGRFRLPREAREEDEYDEGTLVNITLRFPEVGPHDDRVSAVSIPYHTIDSGGRVTIPNRYVRLFDLKNRDEPINVTLMRVNTREEDKGE